MMAPDAPERLADRPKATLGAPRLGPKSWRDVDTGGEGDPGDAGRGIHQRSHDCRRDRRFCAVFKSLPTHGLCRPCAIRTFQAVAFWVDPGASDQLRIASINQRRSIQQIMEEALNDWFEKHRLPSLSASTVNGKAA
jgi:hypothetical protein